MNETGPELAVSRRVVTDVVRLAARETAGVVLVGRSSRWRRLLGSRPVNVRIDDGAVTVTVHIVARSRTQLLAVGEAVRGSVATAVTRVLGLRVAGVTVVVDGVRG
jgi:uncharacterized alkaline shock family protein YloU